MKHYLSIRIANKVFWQEGLGFVQSDVNINGAPPHGFEPLIVVGVFADGLPLSYVQFSRRKDAISIRTMLTRFWSANFLPDEADGICGLPDELVIDETLRDLLSPDLFKWLDGHGVAYDWAPRSNKKLLGKVTSMQRMPAFKSRPTTFNSTILFPINSLNRVNRRRRLSLIENWSQKLIERRIKKHGFRRSIESSKKRYGVEYEPYSTSLFMNPDADYLPHRIERSENDLGFPVLQKPASVYQSERVLAEPKRTFLKEKIWLHPLFPNGLAEKAGIHPNLIMAYLAHEHDLELETIDYLCKMVGYGDRHIPDGEKRAKPNMSVRILCENGSDRWKIMRFIKGLLRYMGGRRRIVEVMSVGRILEDVCTQKMSKSVRRLVFSFDPRGVCELMMIEEDSPGSKILDYMQYGGRGCGSCCIASHIYHQLQCIAEGALVNHDQYMKSCAELYRLVPKLFSRDEQGFYHFGSLDERRRGGRLSQVIGHIQAID